MSDWTPEITRQFLVELRKVNETLSKQIDVLRDLHDVTEALRSELRVMRTERERRERFDEFAKTHKRREHQTK